VSVGTQQNQPKVLILGANSLVRDNVRVLLRSMGYQCLLASARKQALWLLEQEKPEAAILDPHFPDASPAGVVAMFHKRAPGLLGRAIVLLREETDPELLEVLDAYSVPRVRLDALLRELWPCLDSLLRRVLPPRIVTRGAPLVFDSFLELSLAGIRSLGCGCRQLRYESDTLVADFSIEGQNDSGRMTLTGQVLDTAQGEPQVSSVPVVMQGHAGLIGIAKTNQWGEFHFEFEPQPGITLEIRARENFWVSAGLPDLHGVSHRA
jgi:CheY-like chemotaxis protein